MREIKFRAFDGGKMYYFDLFGLDGWYIMDEAHNLTEDGGKNVMQYTGLKDKNGVEIYEGDIIKIPDDYDEYGMMSGEIREVYCLDGCYRLKPKKEGRGHTIDDTYMKLEVIGNIYENPELLQ